jgi:hypothetical protein
MVFPVQIALAPPAAAAFCSGGTIEGFGWLDVLSDNHFGTGMTVSQIDSSQDCLIVRTAYIMDSKFNLVEVGWYDPNGNNMVGNCDTGPHPQVYVFAIVDGGYKCKPGTAQVTDTSRFWVQNINHNKDAQYFWDNNGQNPSGVYLGHYNIDFNQGWSETGDEIHKSDGGENLLANFTDVQYQGSAGGWVTWGSGGTISNGGSDTSGTHYCDYSMFYVTHWRVRLTGDNC